MSVLQAAKDEIRTVALTTLYFVSWLGSLMLMKALVPERVSLGPWTRGRPALPRAATTAPARSGAEPALQVGLLPSMRP